MGQCFVSIADDATALYWNPAGLSKIERTSFSLMHTQLVPDLADDVYYEYASVAYNLGSVGTVAAGLTFLTYGQSFAVGPGGYDDIIGIFTSYEIIPSVGFGTSIVEDLHIGLGLKFAYVRLAPEWATVEKQPGDATAIGADLGVLWELWDERIGLGVAFQHLGTKLAYIDVEQADPLPRNLKVGASYRYRSPIYGSLIVTGEVNKSLIRLSPHQVWGSVGMVANAGVEYEYGDLIAFRTGYVYDDEGEIKNFTFGAGMSYDLLRFDYASVPQHETLDRVHRFSLTVEF
jgi:hypothetical protein